MDRIKRLSYEVLETHKSKFGEDFADNKKALDQISIIRSKGLKNEVAGYITKFIKKEIREEKVKKLQIESAQIEEQKNQESVSDIPPSESTYEDSESSIEIVTEPSTVEDTINTTEEKSE